MTNRHKTKKRNEYVYATTKADVTEIGLTIDPDTQAVHFQQDMTNVYAEVNYDRSKGPKILSRIPQSHSDVSFDASPALEQNYDFVCAVDTNTLGICGKNVSVVGVVTAQPVWAGEKLGLVKAWRFDVPFCLEYVALKTAKPENFGWLAAFEQLTKRGHIDNDRRVGMIVDSDLGSIRDYNERMRRVDGIDYLPKQVTLIYATSDTPNENVANEALSLADSVATQCLDAVASGRLPFNRKPSKNPLFEGLRLVAPNVV
jgi:hypothetical protein